MGFDIFDLIVVDRPKTTKMGHFRPVSKSLEKFIFACVESKQTTGLNHGQRDMRLIDTINKILASYKTAELYREIKLRTALFSGRELQVTFS